MTKTHGEKVPFKIRLQLRLADSHLTGRLFRQIVARELTDGMSCPFSTTMASMKRSILGIPVDSLVFAALVTIGTAGCSSTPIVLKHPVTGDVAECKSNPWKWIAPAAFETKEECALNWIRRGYQLVEKPPSVVPR